MGRFPRIRARLIEPKSPIQFTPRDVTMPDILAEENKENEIIVNSIVKIFFMSSSLIDVLLIKGTSSHF